MSKQAREALIRRHHALNRQTRQGWNSFEGHRRRVMDLLLAPTERASLAILGAGNCNDTELALLSRYYGEVTLVDVDERSLNEGVARQAVPAPSNVHLRAPVELSGVVALLEGIAKGSQESPHAEALAEAIAGDLGLARYDVVASTCLLTQVILAVVDRLGPRHARSAELVRLTRAVHLHLLLALLRPGGQAILISDLVSTDTAKELPSLPTERLPAHLLKLVQQHNFFTGVNPYLLKHELETDPRFSARVERVELQTPWYWALGPERGYLVVALTWTRR